MSTILLYLVKSKNGRERCEVMRDDYCLRPGYESQEELAYLRHVRTIDANLQMPPLDVKEDEHYENELRSLTMDYDGNAIARVKTFFLLCCKAHQVDSCNISKITHVFLDTFCIYARTGAWRKARL